MAPLSLFESHLMFLQIQKVSIVSEGTCKKVPGLLEADLNKHKKVVARITVNDNYFILVFDRLGGREVSPTIPSACNHASPCIIAHPSDPSFVLEGCLDCRVIRNYNIHTGERCIVHTGWRASRMCHGPAGSILVLSHFPGFVILGVQLIRNAYYLYHGENKLSNPSHTKLSILKFDKEQQQLENDNSLELVKFEKLLHMCYYVDRLDMLLVISEDKEIEAIKFGSESPIWKLSEVGGHVFEPDALTSDSEGNVYVGDGANNRILKINGLTGDIVSILLLEKENTMPIDSLFWSDIEPNLTLIRGDRISTYIFKT